MNFDPVIQIFSKIFLLYYGQILIIIGLALFFTLLTFFKHQTALPGKVWWRNPDLATDVCYAIVNNIIGPYLRVPIVVLFLLIITGPLSEDSVNNYFDHPHGPLAESPFWVQAAVYLFATDFLLYWIHRAFHTRMLWRFHAPHHSPKQVDWTTSYRFHPVNLLLQPTLVGVVMLLLGVLSPDVVAYFLPWDIVSPALVHANVRWTFGPLKYFLASPVFHRWHHALPDGGGNTNFAPTFSLFDFLFGTFSIPNDQGPTVFGIDDAAYPTTYIGQLVAPFIPRRATARKEIGV